MTSKTDLILPPNGLPSNYHLLRKVQGPNAIGFHRDPDQSGWFFTRGTATSELSSPLAVHLTKGKKELDATEGHPGEPIQVSDQVVGAYHDGMWTRPATDGGTPIWDSHLAHSITVQLSDASLACRALKKDVSKAELVTLLQSCLS